MNKRIARRSSVQWRCSIVLLFIVAVSAWDIGVNAQRCTTANSQPGQCGALANCAALLDQMYNGAAMYMASQYMGASICGFDGTQFLVCCPTAVAAQQPARYQAVPTFSSNANDAPQLATLAFHFGSLSGLITTTPSTWSPWITAAPQQQPQQPQPQPPPQTQPNANTPPVVFQPVPSVNVPQPPQTPSQPATNAPPLPQVPSTKVAVPSVPSVPAATTGTGIGTTSGSGTCGRIQGTINRVVGGNEARRGSYPWIAALAYNEAGIVQYLCAGSLIASTYVVTSAHCINPQLAYVRLGAHNLADANEAGAINAAIQRTVVHEQFDMRSVVNDIALVQLATPAPQTEMIGLICLPEAANFLTNDFVGMNPFVAGWGATKYQGATATRLREVQVPIVSRQTCEASYKSVFNYVQFNDRIICAGNSNVDACQGDSGGPLMLPQLDGSGSYRFYLLGVVSYGYECARPGFPGVYTRVASFLPWLRQQMI